MSKIIGKYFAYDSYKEALKDIIVDDPLILEAYRTAMKDFPDHPKTPFVFSAWLYYHKLPFYRKLFHSCFWGTVLVRLGVKKVK